MKNNGFVVKKSPIVIVKNFILVEVVAFGTYLLASSLVYYAEIYRSLIISKLISFQIAQAIFIFSIETVLIFYIFFYWYREHFRISSEGVSHASGVLYRKREMVAMDKIASVNISQSPLGKMVKYGRIELKDSSGKKLMVLRSIPEPHETIEIIMGFQRKTGSRMNAGDHEKLLFQDEHEKLEFKSTLRWDLREKKVNRNIERATMKTVAAFLNSRGGNLVLGVDDRKKAVGLSYDFATLGKENADGFENHFSHLFNNMIGAEFRQCVDMHWLRNDGKEICVLSVAPAHKPVYLRDGEQEEFYIRTGNGTTSLKFSEATSYINSRWG